MLGVTEATRIRNWNHLDIAPGESSPNLHDLGDIRSITVVPVILRQFDYDCEHVALAREAGQGRGKALSCTLQARFLEAIRSANLRSIQPVI